VPKMLMARDEDQDLLMPPAENRLNNVRDQKIHPADDQSQETEKAHLPQQGPNQEMNEGGIDPGQELDARKSRRDLTIPAIKEEVEEGHDESQGITTTDPVTDDGTEKLPERRRSRSRDRSPEHLKSPSKSKHRGSSTARQRSPSSSGHNRTRSKSRKRSPSKSRGESRSRSKKPGSRDRSKSRTRSSHRSRSRSHSRTRDKATDEEAKQYLATLSSKQSESRGMPQKSAMKPSFLSRLAESNEKSLGQEEGRGKPKSIKWGESETKIMSPKKSPMVKGALLLSVAEEEIGDSYNEPVKGSSSPKGEGRSRRTRSQSRTRQRSQSRKRRDKSEKKKEKKKKWDDLLHASKESFNFSTDSFYFDTESEVAKPATPMKAIKPTLNPVVLGHDTVAPPSTSNATTEYESTTVEGSPVTKHDVSEMIKSQRERAAESRKRQASIEADSYFNRNKQSNAASNVLSSDSPSAKQKSSIDSKDRLKKASALIHEKRKRRAASRARQTDLEILSPLASQMYESHNLGKGFSPSQFDATRGGAQFSPALRESANALTPKQAQRSSAAFLPEKEGQSEPERSKSPSKKSSRWADMRNGMDEMISKSKRSLMVPSIQEESPSDSKKIKQDEREKSSKTNARRKARSEARRAARTQKMGSSSKWKELSVKVDAMKKPQSFRAGDAPTSPIMAEEPSKPKSLGRSKWAGLKGSMDFVSRMKKASST
ncbi:MAG: hypothetical protein SGILL_007128, partial [Bacillariaceae sp.]